jgi:SEFIR domain/NACHT domain
LSVLSDLSSSKAKHRVFVSYSHDSEEHRIRVKSLADTLGSVPETDCVLDQYVPGEHPIEGWPRWMEQQFDLATRVLCICTQRYGRLLVNDATVERREGRGAHWESELFLAELYREKSTSKKLKAIVLVGDNPDKCVPTWLSKWGWLSFPTSKSDVAFAKLLAYLADSAPAPGPGLPDDYEVGRTLSHREEEFLDWVRRDTIAAVENVKLLGMAKPIKLLDIYYPAVLSTTIARRLYESEWKKADSKDKNGASLTGARKKVGSASFVMGSEFVDSTKRSVVLGGPGAGKTTFLKSLALRYCGVAPGLMTGEPGFAVFVHLPTVAKSGLGILNWLDTQAAACEAGYKGLIGKVAAKISSAFLLDSLDEVPVGNRTAVIEKIQILGRQFPSSRIVISCRTADYEEMLEDYSDVEIARLSSDAITKIVRAWFQDEEESASRLLNLIGADDGVRALTETPLLLSLLCIQFRHDLDLPKRKVELYARCVSVLLRDWDSGRKFRRTTDYEQLTDDRKTKLFEHVAGHFIDDGQRYDLPVAETQDVVGAFIERCGICASQAADVIREIESLHGIIERLSRDHYCFSHNTLQEYFAACRFIAARDELRVVQKYLSQDAWEPIIEFIAAIVDEPGPIFQLLVNASNMSGLSNYPAMAKRTKVLSLLYKCLSTSPLLCTRERKQVVDHLVQSHYHMATIYGAGGVYPFATLRGDGVAHTYVWTSKRPTLAEALKPFRRLSNLIYLNPMEEYAEAVLCAVDGQQWSQDLERRFGIGFGGMIRENLAVSLLVPIAKSFPAEANKRLQKVVDQSKMPFVKKAVTETIQAIGAKHTGG